MLCCRSGYFCAEQKIIRMKLNSVSRIPPEYENLYYLSCLDLKPKRLGDYPFGLSLERCRELYNQGWLFHTREDAMRVREVMKRAYVNEVMTVKGVDNILFNRHLRP